MRHLPALYVALDALKADAALTPGGRGARKILVTELRRQTEQEARQVVWTAPAGSGKCPVQVTTDSEVAVFTQHAPQDRHYHETGTEVYEVLEGRMVIAVEGQTYALSAGDMIVVNPPAVHEVKRQGMRFLCRVVTVNCGGPADKHVV